ncbi:thioredoxin family protein [Clostridium sp. AF19-22AC]|jgi:small redox-active disulfide protein 2|uniref:Small redox-active disulfide protein 2 n=1 Tax=Faecalicatena orotica TaxID=1544 RepID=A0A2Y9BNY7_9FIRM|nr:MULTISPECIES: thioredoxin family protein [Clostridia]PWJ23170.1 small redox-active disulfide protein 2 [Faecalicatena orotica]RHR29471.1 thioredoxin family protein [Clostridium sp. AF19-22AC]SSA57907.1 small redox-active disulfide protein 2 [Faecalicatena orotica]
MEIKVIGTGCEKCNRLYQNVQQAVNELGITANIEKVEELMDIVRLGVMLTPALMVDGKIVITGRVPDVKSLLSILSGNTDK